MSRRTQHYTKGFYLGWDHHTARNVSHYKCLKNIYSFLYGTTFLSGPVPSPDRGFMITLRHTTLATTPLDEWSARFRDLYLVGIVIPLQAWCGPESGYSSTTAALEGSEWSAARHGRTLPPGKTRYPFYGRMGGPQGRSGLAVNLVPTGIRSRTVQTIVSRYTDWATRSTRPLPDNTKNRDSHPCHRRDSNSQPNQGSGRRPTPWTARPPGSPPPPPFKIYFQKYKFYLLQRRLELA